MAQINLSMIEEDFQQLITVSMRWLDVPWEKQATRFEPIPSFSWKMAYWVDTYAEVMLCRAFLTTKALETQTVFDSVMNCHLILTDFETEEWISEPKGNREIE